MLPHFLPLVDPMAENRHPKWSRETSRPAKRLVSLTPVFDRHHQSS